MGTTEAKAWWEEIEFRGLGRWGMGRGSPSGLLLSPTPTLCQGIRRISPVTRAEEFYYPPWKRLLFQLLVSLPLCLTCLACVFLLMLGCFQLQVTSSPQPWPWSLTWQPPAQVHSELSPMPG